MTRYAALLRGVNVGSVTMKMSELAAVAGDPASFIRGFTSEGYEAVVAIVITPFRDSVVNVFQAIQTLGTEGIRYVAVINLDRGDLDDFGLFFGEETFGLEGTAAKLIETVGGKVMVFPRLKPGVLARIDKRDLNFSRALDPASGTARADRMAIERWLRDVRDSAAGTGVLLRG